MTAAEFLARNPEYGKVPDVLANLKGDPVPETPPRCELCRDTGWRVALRKNTAERCRCQAPRQNEELLRIEMERAGMAPKEIRIAFKDWDAQPNRPEPKRCAAWLKAAAEGFPPEPLARLRQAWPYLAAEPVPILILGGDTGLGKTMTLAKLVRRWLVLEKPRPIFWINYAAALDRIMMERKENGSSEYERQLLGAKLVAVDDFGRDSKVDRDGNRTACAINLMTQWERQETVVVVTANVKALKDLTADVRLRSRISAGFWYPFADAPDYRGLR